MARRTSAGLEPNPRKPLCAREARGLPRAGATVHVIDNGNTFVFDLHETYTYTLVFDDPALGTWTAHAAENIHNVANHSGEVFMHNFNSKEGPIQIIQHQRIQVDADGNVKVDRTFERIGDC
jgi:hypothetical protein